MLHFIRFAVLLLISAVAATAQDTQNFLGFLGNAHAKNISKGEIYEITVSSYTFKPGFYYTAPDGERLHSFPEDVLEVWNDGTSDVYTTRATFIASQTGRYVLQVFAWDDVQGGSSYSMDVRFVGELVEEPDEPAEGEDAEGAESNDPENQESEEQAEENATN